MSALILLFVAGILAALAGIALCETRRAATGAALFYTGIVVCAVAVVVLFFQLLSSAAFARDLDGRYAQSPLIAVLATICLDRSCQDVVVTTSDQAARVTMTSCAIGQRELADWMQRNWPGYRLDGWKCVIGAKRRGA